MKVLIFTEGTILMHWNAAGCTREEKVKQVQEEEESVEDYASYLPIGNVVEKLKTWKRKGAKIMYLTSRKELSEVTEIQNVLERYGFPKGQLFYCKEGEAYQDIIERVKPDILIEDDCESIGGRDKMCITHVKPEIKKKIKSIVVKEFEGINALSEISWCLISKKVETIK